MTNPYAVWNTPPANRSSSSGSLEPLPSIYGALPFPDAHTQPRDHQAQYPVITPSHVPLITFTLTGFNPSITNCTVLGPNNSPQYLVCTDPIGMPGYTILKSADGKRSSALIEWQKPAKVEIRGVLLKQHVSRLLRVSSDGRYRIMVIGTQEFMWLPHHSGSVKLYTANAPGTSEFLGQLSVRSSSVDMSGGAIMLALTESAIRAGLLQTCIVAAVLLYSGRNID